MLVFPNVMRWPFLCPKQKKFVLFLHENSLEFSNSGSFVPGHNNGCRNVRGKPSIQNQNSFTVTVFSKKNYPKNLKFPVNNIEKIPSLEWQLTGQS